MEKRLNQIKEDIKAFFKEAWSYAAGVTFVVGLVIGWLIGSY